ncbi:phosphotransferase family protein [Ornithinibacillus halotolerans]|uniref:Aminoglycoside phosphotransferase n=1 Tax=Ornithinibacillus halotolerans TaxID=1274357 RepID=A0A916W7X3_9BACI|nr:aminoglycoside phosphotransferase family protein [Ornithinibacillus halotolerans]GGA76406.1 aminoglycoside phosphotransferase [Ornithinibacillus halotolerans]
MDLGHPIAAGNTAKIYLYNKQIVKVFHRRFPKTEAAYEAKKQQTIYATGLPVPKVIEIKKVDDSPAIVMEYVEGQTLGELFLRNKEKAIDYINMSINVQKEIHSITTTSLESMTSKLKRQILSTKKITENQKTILNTLLDKMSFEEKLCHGDFHLFNLILSKDGTVYIIDWVDASVGDIRADICRSYLLYLQFSEELAEQYLSLYCEKSGLEIDEILKWAPIIAAARLAENVASEDEERLLNIIKRHGIN